MRHRMRYQAQKPRTGRDSIAQGAAKRSPGLRSIKCVSPKGARFPSLTRNVGVVEFPPVGAFTELRVANPGLRRLSRLRTGLSNLAPFGAFICLLISSSAAPAEDLPAPGSVSVHPPAIELRH